MTLKRTLTREAKIEGIKSLDKVEKLAKNRDLWKDTLQALCDICAWEGCKM